MRDCCVMTDMRTLHETLFAKMETIFLSGLRGDQSHHRREGLASREREPLEAVAHMMI